MIYLIIILLFNVNILADTLINGNNQGWGKTKIYNGSKIYSKKNGRIIKIKEFNEEPDSFTELFLNFNNEKPSEVKDMSEHYGILKSKYRINENIKFQGTLTAGFLDPSDKVEVKVDKKSWLANSVDLGNFTIDFWIYPTLLNDSKIVYKGIYNEGIFYGFMIKSFENMIVIEFLNMFYDTEGKTYSIVMDNKYKLKRYEWHHIAVTFNRQRGMIEEIINGKIIDFKFATKTGNIKDEILVPHFFEKDGSDLILCENFFGYMDNFRISRNNIREFLLDNTMYMEGAKIISDIIDLGYFNSSIDKIEFQFSNITDTTSKIYIRYSNNEFSMNERTNIIEGLESNSIVKRDIKNLRYFQWEVMLYRNPDGSSPSLNRVEIDYSKNIPPNPPRIMTLKREDKSSVKIEWESSNEDDLKGYIIYWGRRTNEYENKLDVGKNLSYIIQLSGKGYYYFRVTAYDSKEPYNESKFSNEERIYIR